MSETLSAPFNCNRAIQLLVDEAGMRQHEIARAIGLTQGRVSHFYNGNGNGVQGMRYESYYKLSQLCKKHGIEPQVAYGN